MSSKENEIEKFFEVRHKLETLAKGRKLTRNFCNELSSKNCGIPKLCSLPFIDIKDVLKYCRKQRQSSSQVKIESLKREADLKNLIEGSTVYAARESSGTPIIQDVLVAQAMDLNVSEDSLMWETMDESSLNDTQALLDEVAELLDEDVNTASLRLSGLTLEPVSSDLREIEDISTSIGETSLSLAMTSHESATVEEPPKASTSTQANSAALSSIHIPNVSESILTQAGNSSAFSLPVFMRLEARMLEIKKQLIAKKPITTFDTLMTDDETDTEENPYNRYPEWCKDKKEKIALQEKINPDLIDGLFASVGNVDHKEIFPNENPEKFKRHLSSVWE